MNNMEKQLENNLGARLLQKFRAETNKDLDLGDGLVLKLKIPQTYVEYTQLLEQAKERFIEAKGEDGDPNFIYCYLLESVITNLNQMEIQQIVFEAPGLTDIIIKAIDNASGNVITRLEAEAVEKSKKKSKMKSGGS